LIELSDDQPVRDKSLSNIGQLLVYSGGPIPGVNDLSQVIGKLLFFDNEKALCARLNQPEDPKSLHKLADPGPRGANHLRQFCV
jgi:hypothetical protein